MAEQLRLKVPLVVVSSNHLQMNYEYLQGWRLDSSYAGVKCSGPGINHTLKKYLLFGDTGAA